MKRFSLATAVFVLMSTAVFAAPSSIGDCEKIADADAYNRCLGQFGPAMKGGRPAQAEVPANADTPKISRGSRGKGRYARRGSRGGSTIGRGGRVRMEIAVGGGRKFSRGRGRRR